MGKLFALGFVYLHAGEFTCASRSVVSSVLEVSDVVVDFQMAPSCMTSFETMPFNAGVRLHIGHTGYMLCPVAAMLGIFSGRYPCSEPLFFFQ